MKIKKIIFHSFFLSSGAPGALEPDEGNQKHVF